MARNFRKLPIASVKPEEFSYLCARGRGIGLYDKIDGYALQGLGESTFEANEALGFPADARSHGAVSQLLKLCGDVEISLLTNTPDKVSH